MLVDLVRTARCVGLPDLDQRLRRRVRSVLVEDAAFDEDALAEGLAGVLPREVTVGNVHAARGAYTPDP